MNRAYNSDAYNSDFLTHTGHRIHLLLGMLLAIVALSSSLHAQGIDPTRVPTDEQPPRVAMLEQGSGDVVNILLIGSATTNPSNPGLTDVLMIMSVNLDLPAVSVLSLPRDLFVYLPYLRRVKMNQVYFYGEQMTERDGIDALYDTIRYNFGIEIDHYVRVDFNTMPDLIDALGGITLGVDCAIQDWRLKEPDLDRFDEDNWAMYTLLTGNRYMDGELALWYMRSRRTSSDLDRNRRQQDVLRAVWRRIRAQDLLGDLPQLWGIVNELVETDMTIADAYSFLPLARQLDLSDVRFMQFTYQRDIDQARNDQGQFIFVGKQPMFHDVLQTFVLPPASNVLSEARPTVAVYNGTSIRNMHLVAAQRLEKEGFAVTVMDDAVTPRTTHLLTDYTGLTKGNPVETIQRIFGVGTADTQVDADPQRDFDYTLVIGENYLYRSCTYNVRQPILDELTDDDWVN